MITGVLIDWGGVLTTSLSVSIGKWIEADRIDDAHYRAVMRELIDQAYGGDQESVVHALERGEMDGAAFERDLAARLRTVDGVSPAAEGLLERMFAGFERVDAMYDMLHDVKRNGVKTCLLSNSWSNVYPRDGWDELFDAVVISGEVGMRKPEPRIFLHAAQLIGLEPAQCIFVDDIQANVDAAEQIGFTGVLHDQAAATAQRIATLLDVDLG